MHLRIRRSCNPRRLRAGEGSFLLPAALLRVCSKRLERHASAEVPRTEGADSSGWPRGEGLEDVMDRRDLHRRVARARRMLVVDTQPPINPSRRTSIPPLSGVPAVRIAASRARSTGSSPRRPCRPPGVRRRPSQLAIDAGGPRQGLRSGEIRPSSVKRSASTLTESTRRGRRDRFARMIRSSDAGGSATRRRLLELSVVFGRRVLEDHT